MSAPPSGLTRKCVLPADPQGSADRVERQQRHGVYPTLGSVVGMILARLGPARQAKGVQRSARRSAHDRQLPAPFGLTYNLPGSVGFPATGSETRKRLPFPNSLSTRMLPP